MGDIAQRGNRLTFAKGGVVKRPKKPSTHAKAIPTQAAEGGRAGHALGHVAGKAITKTLERLGGGEEGKPHSTKKGRIASGVRRIKRGLSARQRDKWGDLPPWRRDSKADGGRVGLKKGMPGMVKKAGDIERLKKAAIKKHPQLKDKLK